MTELFEQLADSDFETLDANRAALVIRLSRSFAEQRGLASDVNAVEALQAALREGRTKGSAAVNLRMVRHFVDGDDMTAGETARVQAIVLDWSKAFAEERIKAWSLRDRASDENPEGNPVVLSLQSLLEVNPASFLDRARLLLSVATFEKAEALRTLDQAREGRERRRAALEREMQDPIFAATLEAAVALESQNEWDPMLPFLRRAIGARLLSRDDQDTRDLGRCCSMLEAFAAFRHGFSYVHHGGRVFHNCHFNGQPINRESP